MPFELLKKYLIYAKRHFKPKLSKIDQDKVTNFYAEIRKESNVVGGIPIAVRHIESLIRMSEAHAKLHLRDEVSILDIDVAIELLLDSFIQSQKHSVGRQLLKKFEKYKQRTMDTSYLLLHILQKCVKNKVRTSIRSLIAIDRTLDFHFFKRIYLILLKFICFKLINFLF